MPDSPDNRNDFDSRIRNALGPDPGKRGGDSLLRRVVGRVAVAQRRGLLIRLLIAISLVTTLTYLDTAFLGWSVAVGAAIAMVPLSRARQYAIAFLPYGALWLIFTLLRSMANETGAAHG